MTDTIPVAEVDGYRATLERIARGVSRNPADDAKMVLIAYDAWKDDEAAAARFWPHGSTCPPRRSA